MAKENAQMLQIVDYWHSIEVLTPQALPKEEKENTFFITEDTQLPWPITPPDGKEIFFAVYTGLVSLDEVQKELCALYGHNDKIEGNFPTGTGCVAAFIVDSKGKPIEASFWLSSFFWGMGQLRAGNYKLRKFAIAEDGIKNRFRERCTNYKNLSLENIKEEIQQVHKAIDWEPSSCNLPLAMVVKIEVTKKKDKEITEPPSLSIMNSFFLSDLDAVYKAIEKKDTGTVLKAYLGKKENDQEKIDLVLNKTALQARLSPRNLPTASWPGKGLHPLALMQQAAVNTTFETLDSKAGLLSVNGPPGTGKTTLLRDIIVGIIVKRAMALSKFQNPKDAFQPGESCIVENRKKSGWKLDKSLKGFEIVVASSNNNAVQNITQEIPDIKAIDQSYLGEVECFSTLATDLLTPFQKEKDKKERVEKPAWGLVAAALGNSSNKSTFVSKFWFGEYSMRQLLTAAPNVDWKRAVNEFKDALDKEQEFRKKLETGEVYLQEINQLQHKTEAARDVLFNTTTQISEQLERKTKDSLLFGQAQEKIGRWGQRLEILKLSKPGFIARVFRLETWRQWIEKVTALDKDFEETNTVLEITRTSLQKYEQELAKLDKKEQEEKAIVEELEKQLNIRYQLINELQTILGASFPDEEFWSLPDSQREKLQPWVSKEHNKLRYMVFAKAMALHKAFILSAAEPMKANLDLAMDLLRGNVSPYFLEDMLSDVWSCLFLTVPVISTTFASYSRLFAGMQKESLGWLLVDEAGQATPQAAVGALWRTQRAVIIGDPLQIEPVVTIPESIIETLRKNHKVAIDWDVRITSVQRLCDQANPFGTFIEKEWIGMPLRVHRRCNEPMFSLANAIAYNGFMVQATAPNSSPVGQVLGESCWFNVEGQTSKDTHWIKEEGDCLKQLVSLLKNNGLYKPNLFVISPFKSVSNQAIKLNILPYANVGTIHTFQGREAEAVVLLLGGGTPGARLWAGSRPNMLNVAATRAKERLYVIGNARAWSSAGYFSELKKTLTIKSF